MAKAIIGIPIVKRTQRRKHGPKLGQLHQMPDAKEIKSHVRATGLTAMETFLAKRDFWLGRINDEYKKKKPDLDFIGTCFDKASDAAAEFAPYVHRKLASVRVENEPFDLSRLTEDELRLLQRLQDKISPRLIDSSGTSET